MLAYVFWHAPRDGVEPAEYVAALVAFHAALAADPPLGFLRSFSSSTSRLPWLEAHTAYEDWYLVEDSAALDPLNAAAIDLRRRGVHEAAAQRTGIGAGGLYRLLHGELIVPVQTTWFAKPDGMTYVDFAPTLDLLIRSGATLWQRQMLLGPTPEYAAQTQTNVEGDSFARIDHVELV